MFLKLDYNFKSQLFIESIALKRLLRHTQIYGFYFERERLSHWAINVIGRHIVGKSQ